MYDYKTAVNRLSQGSAKWQEMVAENPQVGQDIFPFSVADTDMVYPPEFTDELKAFVDVGIFGYTSGTTEYYAAVMDWLKKEHNWQVKEEWIIQSPGVIAALYNTIRTFTVEDDGVIIMPPVYYPFKKSIENTQRKVVENPLILRNGRYEIDFTRLEELVKDPCNKLLIFCSPHNPVGRVWRKEELEKVAQLCCAHQVLMLSDEIHFDLVMPGHQHTVMATLSEEAAQNVIVCTAPSKTFNLAGMQTSNIVIPNDQLRASYREFIANNGFHGINIMGQKMCEIVYTKGKPWLTGFLELVQRNHELLKNYLNEHIPEVKVFDLEGTYLQWLDFSALNMAPNELESFMKQEAEVFFDEGYIFGKEGEGFERMNIACPTDVMLKGLERINTKLKERKS